MIRMPGAKQVSFVPTAQIDGLLMEENGALRDRVTDLEKRLGEKSDEITCLKSTMADCLRRLHILETTARAYQSGKASSSARQSGGGSRRSASSRASSRHSTGSVAGDSGGNTGAQIRKSTANTLNAAPLPHRARSGARNLSASSTALDHGAAGKYVGSGPGGSPQQSLGQSSPGGTATTPLMSLSMSRVETSMGRQQQQMLATSPTPSWRPGGLAIKVVSSPPPPTPQQKKLAQSKNPAYYLDTNVKDPIFNKDEGILRTYLRGRAINVYAPSSVADYDAKAVAEAPAERLRMEWVYGYRGRDCRSNVHFLPTGEVIYFVASIVVLYNIEEQLQRHYLGHTDDVKCIALHPDRITIATGQVTGHEKTQGKAHVRIWNSVNLNTTHVIGLGDFERGVCCVAFSKTDGGNLLCAVDEANEHTISVWQWQKEHRITETKCSNEPVLASEFHPLENDLIVTCGKGQLAFWSLDGCQLVKKMATFEKYEKPKFVLCLTFAENGDLITGDSNGNLFIWRTGGQKISQALLGAHEGNIFSVCVTKEGQLVSSGGKDRRLVLWDAAYNRTGQEVEIEPHFGPVRTVSHGPGRLLLVGTTKNCILQGSFGLEFRPILMGHSEEVWGLATHPTHHQFLTASYDRSVILWDGLTRQAVWTKELSDPLHSAAFYPAPISSGGDSSQPQLVVAIGSQVGRWFVLDVTRREIAAVHTDGNEQIQCLAYSPDGSYLALGSRDNSIYVYGTFEGGRKYTRIGKCTGHSSFVLHLDWSSDGQLLRSTSGDYEVLYWSAHNCRQVTAVGSLRDVSWASHRCVLGWGAIGIWPEGADGTDINACARTRGQGQRALLVSADDFGKVNLFAYPACQPKSGCHSYPGHSSHVTNVDFLFDDSRIISTGGQDTAVIQWEII